MVAVFILWAVYIGPSDPLRSRAVPLTPKPFRMVVGTRPTSEWLLPGSDHPEQLPVKAELLRTRPGDVLAALPGAEEGIAALAEMVRQAVPDLESGADHELPPKYYQGRPAERELADVSLRVQEDLCLMQRRSHQWRLWAAAVCFPSGWRVADKIGAGLDAIHNPVPGYAARLARASTQALDRVAAGDAIVERFNWVLVDSPRLVVAEGGVDGQSDPAPPEQLWLRTERQTMRPVPDGLGVVFTIRTFLTPLADLTGREQRALRESLRGVSDELAEYRSSLGYRDAVASWLAAVDRSA